MTALARRHRISRQLRQLNPYRPAGRKTTRTVTARRKPHEMPDYTVSMILPAGTSVKPGESFGARSLTIRRIGNHDHAIVTGKNRDWTIDQAKAFLRAMEIPRMQAVLRRADEPGPTDSGPVRKGYERALWIEAKGETYLEKGEGGTVAMRTLMLPLFAEGR